MRRRILVPVLLDLTGSRILFVGAGEGTRTKLSGMASQDPKVRIVAPEVGPEVTVLAGTLTDAEILVRPFEDTDLEGVSLVYVFTGDSALNTRIAGLCRARNLWHNAAQNRDTLSFTSPAAARKDGLIAAFSTETSEPDRAVKARDAWVGSR